MNTISELKQMAESYGLDFKEVSSGHIQLSNHGTLVNYWPLSKNRTCHVKNGAVVKHCSNYDAVKLCMKSGKTGLKPKKKDIKENVAHGKFDTVQSDTCVKHLYNGEKAPWEFPSRIMCYPDILRIESRKLLNEAAQMETPEFYQDCNVKLP